MSTANYVDAVREMAAGKKPTKVYAGMPKEDRERLKEEKKAEKLAVKEEAKAEKARAKEAEKQANIEAKVKAKFDREIAKSDEKAIKLLEKDAEKQAKIDAKAQVNAEKQAIKDTIRAEKQAEKDAIKAQKQNIKDALRAEKLEAKEATNALKLFQKNALKAVKMQETEAKNKAKKQAQEELKLHNKSIKKARNIIAECASRTIQPNEQANIASNHLFQKSPEDLDETETKTMNDFVEKNASKWKVWTRLIVKTWNTQSNDYVPDMWSAEYNKILVVESTVQEDSSDDTQVYVTSVLDSYSKSTVNY